MRQNEKVSSYSILMNITLFALKGSAALLSGSLSAMADTIHSSIDLLASVIVFIGLKISKRKTVRFPYGLYKVENLVSLLVAFFILYAGYEIVLEVFSGEYNAITHFYPVLGLYSIIFILTYAFSRYELKIAQKIGSPSLMADGKHIRVDMFSVGAVMIGFVGEYLGFRIDKIAALVVVVLILQTSLELIINTVKVLLDGSLEEEKIERIREIILTEPTVRKIKELRGRNSGNYVFVEANIVVDSSNFNEAHKATERIERAIGSALENVKLIRIHYEPALAELPKREFSLPGRRRREFQEASAGYAFGEISEDIKAKGCGPRGNRRRMGVKSSSCAREQEISEVGSPLPA